MSRQHHHERGQCQWGTDRDMDKGLGNNNMVVGGVVDLSVDMVLGMDNMVGMA